MRVCVFVDGENLRHTICDLYDNFDPRDYLPKTANWSEFYDHVVDTATQGDGKRLRTYWYVVQHFDPYPRPLPERSRSPAELDAWEKANKKCLDEYTIPTEPPRRAKVLTEIQEDLTTNLEKMRGRFDGWTTLQNGIAQKHRAVEFRRSGSISYNLTNKRLGQEKTVDVNLAVDMVMLKSNYDTAIIVSGDQDYVPAAQAVKNMGKQVINVAFLARSGVLLPGGARRLNHVTDWSIAIDWDKFRGFLRIPKEA
jgi:uncharacterized LabA/DUF88 family protein